MDAISMTNNLCLTSLCTVVSVCRVEDVAMMQRGDGS